MTARWRVGQLYTVNDVLRTVLIDGVVGAAIPPGVLRRWIAEESTVACFQGNVRCPAVVTPSYLEEAKGQGVCANERDKYYCNVACTKDGQVNWLGAVCPNDLVSPCPPWKRTVIPEYNPAAAPMPPTLIHGPEVQPATTGDTQAADNVATASTGRLRGDRASGEALLAQASAPDAELVRKTGGFTLRGAGVRRLGVHCCAGCDPR